MKPLANSILLACFAAQISLAAEPSRAIQDLTLDDHTVYIVPVSGSRVTTISFPSAISAIDAALVTTDAKTAGLFQFLISLAVEREDPMNLIDVFCAAIVQSLRENRA
jgi:hypothetical protein